MSPGGGTTTGASPGAGRVIAGTARGIRLVGAPEGVRPLGDRLKQALFAILEPELRGGPFLDLFAGSGAAGIEALSRGATSATFVESDRQAVATLERNLAATHLDGSRALVVRADALAWLDTARPAEAYRVAVVDPPYDRPALLVSTLERLAAGGPGVIIAGEGVVVAKHPARTSPSAHFGLLRSVRERRFGESALTFYRWSDGEAG